MTQARSKQYSPCFLVKTSPDEGWLTFSQNTEARLGDSGCLGCLRSMTFGKVQKGDLLEEANKNGQNSRME